MQSGTNAVLVVKHRDMNEKELEAQVRPPAAPRPVGTPPTFWPPPSPQGAAEFPFLRRRHGGRSWRTTSLRKRRRRRWRLRRRHQAQVSGVLGTGGIPWGVGGSALMALSL